MSVQETKKHVFNPRTDDRFYATYEVTHDSKKIIVKYDPNTESKKKFELTNFGEYGRPIPYYSRTQKKFFVGEVKSKENQEKHGQLTGCYELKLVGKTMSVSQPDPQSLSDPTKMLIDVKYLTPPDSIMEYLKQIGYGERNEWRFNPPYCDYYPKVSVQKQIPVEKLDEYNNKMEQFKRLMDEVSKLGTFQKVWLPSVTADFRPSIEYSQEVGDPVGIDLTEAGFVVYGFIGDPLYQHVMSDENFECTTHVSIRMFEQNPDALTNAMVLLPYENSTAYDKQNKCYRDRYGGMRPCLFGKRCYKFYLGELDFDLELEKVHLARKDADIPGLHPLARLFDPDINKYSGKKYSNYILGTEGDKIYEYALDHYPVMFFS